ncbi:MAG: hypothetical protein AAF141_08360 [Pseudomonadota bacterium]
MLRVGLIGTAIAALLGLTPILAAMGLPDDSSQFVANLALTFLGFFLAIALLGWMRGRRS